METKYNLMIFVLLISTVGIAIFIHIEVLNTLYEFPDNYLDEPMTIPRIVLDVIGISVALTIPYALFKIRSEDTHRPILLLVILCLFVSIIYSSVLYYFTGFENLYIYNLYL